MRRKRCLRIGKKQLKMSARQLKYCTCSLMTALICNYRLQQRQQALSLLTKRDLESVCLFLNEQRRSVDEAMWQYCDEKESLRKGLLRELFLCLRFEGCDGTQHLAAALAKTQNELNGQDAQLQTADTRLLSKKSREFLLDGEGNILIDRYEWFLYQQIPDRLNGQLTLPDITKYRALDADLIDGEHWRKTNIRCFNRAILQN